jgi:hypothetical protein
MGTVDQKVERFSWSGGVSFSALWYGMVTTVNNNVLHISQLLKE